MQLSVWAPRSRTVEVDRDGARRPLAADPGGGWWRLPDDLPAGTDYAVVLDGGPPLPDPRAPWLPHGVHGRARALDHGDFAWSDADFEPTPLERAVFYELHVGTFSPAGTFGGAIEKLPHLRGLGVTHVEVMPVASFAGRFGWGYDGVGLFAPHEPYGGPEGLKRFVDACHAAGLAVLIDVVYNHLGPEGNVLDRFGPYMTDRYKTPWGPAMNLDGPDSDEVRRFLCDNAKSWLRDYHADGLRLDAVHGIVDTSAVHFLEELALEVEALERQLRRPFLLVAESDLNDPRIVRPRHLGGYGLHAQWNDDFHHALHAVLTGERAGYYADFGELADLEQALARAFVYDGRYSAHRRRRHGRPTTGLTGHHFVAYIQNHDQVGNRALGERIAGLVGPDLAKVAAAFVLLGPFLPLLFQGEEWAASAPFLFFADHGDPELVAAVRAGRRQEFAAFHRGDDLPDPESEASFRRSCLDWAEIEREPHASVLAWYRELLDLRARLPEPRDPRLHQVRCRFDEAARWFVCQRGAVVIAANLGSEPATISELTAGCEVLAASAACEPSGDGLSVPAAAVVVARVPEQPAAGQDSG
jgi:maltooligosyltrehalose trehalohydrolase